MKSNQAYASENENTTKIDAPELYTDEGKQALAYLRSILPEGSEAVLSTRKDRRQKFGRYLGTFWVEDQNINEHLVLKGYAGIYGA